MVQAGSVCEWKFDGERYSAYEQVTYRSLPKLSDDRMCFGCGGKNAAGLRLSFTVDEKKKVIECRWTPAKEHQGYADIVHGGMIGLVLDELMGNLLWRTGFPSVTGEMTVRFLRPAKVGLPLDCKAHIKSRKGRIFQMEATAADSQGRPVARAAGKFFNVQRPHPSTGSG